MGAVGRLIGSRAVAGAVAVSVVAGAALAWSLWPPSPGHRAVVVEADPTLPSVDVVPTPSVTSPDTPSDTVSMSPTPNDSSDVGTPTPTPFVHGREGNGRTMTSPQSISRDGRYVVFSSYASNLVPGDGPSNEAEQSPGPAYGLDVFLRDNVTNSTTMISVTRNGRPANDESMWPAISSDGSRVAFCSSASDLVPGDTNGKSDVFVRDLESGRTRRVSVSSAGVEANGSSCTASISGNGRYVAFESDASNLVAGDANGQAAVFRYDLVTGDLIPISLTATGDIAHGFAPTISSDGGSVAFFSDAKALTGGDERGIFLRDVAAGTTTELVSTGMGRGAVGSIGLSDDTTKVAFKAFSDTLVAGDTNGKADVFILDRTSGSITRVSVTSDGGQGDGWSGDPAISGDGRYVVFNSNASLVTPDRNPCTDSDYEGTTLCGGSDIYLHDLATGKTTLVSVASDGTQADEDSSQPWISEDGRFVAFMSQARTLVRPDTNVCEALVTPTEPCWDAFRRDLATGETVRLSDS